MNPEINEGKVSFWALKEITDLIVKTRFSFADERQLQDRIEDLFKTNSIPYLREFIMSPANRIDFLCGRIGIEVKVKSPVATVERQLRRYSTDERIDSLILVTTRAGHRGVGRELSNKPVVVAYLLNSIF